MPFCSRCGKQNPQDASFCNYCGYQLGVPQASFEQAPSYKVVRLRHAYCNGSGIDRRKGLMGVTCQTCEGTGELQLRTESTERLVKCPICRGSGVDHKTSLMGVECKRCYGTGQIPQKPLTYQ